MDPVEPRATDPPVRHRRWMLVPLGGLIVVGATLAWSAGLSQEFRLEDLTRLRACVQGQGGWAPILHILGYVLLELVFVPALRLSIVGGIVFGPLWVTVYVLIGAAGAAALAFLLARHGARDLATRWMAAYPRLRRLDAAVVEHGWRILVITRLVPLFEFTLQNFAYGLTGICFSTYVLLTAVCSLPGTAALTFFGGALGEGGSDLRRCAFYAAVAAGLLIAQPPSAVAPAAGRHPGSPGRAE